jgi:hypothetical protein
MLSLRVTINGSATLLSTLRSRIAPLASHRQVDFLHRYKNRVMSSNAMTRPTSKVAICQICSTEDVEHNLEISKRIVKDAVAAGAQVRRLIRVYTDDVSDSGYNNVVFVHRLVSYRKLRISSCLLIKRAMNFHKLSRHIDIL